MEWISVNDGLPVMGKDVLVKLRNVKLPTISQLYFMSCTDAQGKEFKYKTWRSGTATHWMPFKAPPKNKKDMH